MVFSVFHQNGRITITTREWRKVKFMEQCRHKEIWCG